MSSPPSHQRPIRSTQRRPTSQSVRRELSLDDSLMDTLDLTPISHGETYNGVLQEEPIQITVAIMSEPDYNLLCEILERAQAIQLSSPSSDSSLSFLRILHAYDEILLRHDMIPNTDTEVFQWLVTLNIGMSDTQDVQTVIPASATSSPTRRLKQQRPQSHLTYETWQAKLDQLYDQGEEARRATLQLKQSQQQQQHLLLPSHPQHQSDELSLEALESSNSSTSSPSGAPSPHVTFPTNPTTESQLRTSTGFGVLKPTASSSGNGTTVDPKSKSRPAIIEFELKQEPDEENEFMVSTSSTKPAPTPSSVKPVLNKDRKSMMFELAQEEHEENEFAISVNPPKNKSSAKARHAIETELEKEAREEQEFVDSITKPKNATSQARQVIETEMEKEAREEQEFVESLQKQPNQKSQNGPNAISASRSLMVECFTSWQQLCQPRYQLLVRVQQRQRRKLLDAYLECWRIWKQQLTELRFERYLGVIAHTYQQDQIRNLLLYWHSLVQQRRAWLQKRRELQTLQYYERWRTHFKEQQYERQLEMDATQHFATRKCDDALIQWGLFVHRRRQHKLELAQVRQCVYQQLKEQMFVNWLRAQAFNASYLKQAQHHLLRLRRHQCLLRWISVVRLRHSPAHQSTLSIPQFHILWRWCALSFGSGYDIMRIIKLSRMKYQPAVSTTVPLSEEERLAGTRDTPHWRMEALETISPNPHTHPFIGGPSPEISLAATAAAPFSSVGAASFSSSSPSVHFAQSVPYDSTSSFSPSTVVSTVLQPTDSTQPSPTVLGAPASTLNIPLPPHHDPDLPMRHAILTALNHSILFRQHKLSGLLERIQLWARWYIRHLFKHWRANVALQQQQRKALAVMKSKEKAKEDKIVEIHHRVIKSAAWERWQGSFQMATYYSMLFSTFKQHQKKRLITSHYILWKFAFVSLKARKLFRLKRALSEWKQLVKDSKHMMRKHCIIEYTHRRNLVELVWSHWRAALNRNRETKHGMLGLLWNRWKELYITNMTRKQENKDADIYYALKVLMKYLLTWRALSITQTIAGKYAHKAVHHYHSVISHRHIVWWVNWKRYRQDSKRIIQHGSNVYQRKLTVGAIRLWRENIRSQVYRHRQYRDCVAGVRNKFLARAALFTWKYILSLKVHEYRIQHLLRVNMERRIWIRWHDTIRLKNVRYADLEHHVMLRRDFNMMGDIFTAWLLSSTDIRKAKRLQRHCETVWYYVLIKRLFLAWRYVAHQVHQDQLKQAKILHLRTQKSVVRRGYIRQWQAHIAHMKQYRSVIQAARVRLSERWEAKRFLRLWKEVTQQHAKGQHFLQTHHARFLQQKHYILWRTEYLGRILLKQKIAAVVQKQAIRVQKYNFLRWAHQFVEFGKQRKKKLDAICDKLRLKYLLQVVDEWKVFKSESRVQVQAIRFHRRCLKAHIFKIWHQNYVEHHREQRAQLWSEAYSRRLELSRIYFAWKASHRSESIHRRFLFMKCFLAWKRYVTVQKNHKRIAVEFKENFHIRRLRFMFGVWQRFCKLFFNKQKRKLTDRQTRSNMKDHTERIRYWRRWTQVRRSAREKYLTVSTTNHQQLVKNTFAHWWSLYQQKLWGRSLMVFATKTHQRSALLKSVRSWHDHTVYAQELEQRFQQSRRLYLGSLLTRVYHQWQRNQLIWNANTVNLVHRFNQRRLRAIYDRWKFMTGRRSRILEIHQKYLSATLQTWSQHAAESYRERVLYPRADEFNTSRIQKLALSHWYRYRGIHHAVSIVQPKMIRRLKSEIFYHWMTLFQLRVDISVFESEVADKQARRRKNYAIKIWTSKVNVRKERLANLESFQLFMKQQSIRRWYKEWRQRLQNLRKLSTKADASFKAGPGHRIQSHLFRSWHKLFIFWIQSAEIQERGAAHELQITNSRKVSSRFFQWVGVAAYGANIRRAQQRIEKWYRLRQSVAYFYAWSALYRHSIGLKRMNRFKNLFIARQAMAIWRTEIKLIQTYEVTRAAHLCFVQKVHLDGWFQRVKNRQKERSQVALLQSRLRAKLSTVRGANSWMNSKQLIIPMLKQWMSGESSIKFYFQVWSRYRQHCKSFQSANEIADHHYTRMILLPAGWKEWKLILLKVQRHKQAVIQHERQCKKRFVAHLITMMQRQYIRIKQRTHADETARRNHTKLIWNGWRKETVRILEERAVIVRAAQVKFFSIWVEKLRFRKGMERKMNLAESHHETHLLQKTHAHWKSYWDYLGTLQSRATVLNQKIDHWFLGRLFSGWLDRYRRRQWRRQRTQLILHAVRTIWQKNAFLAWHQHVLGVLQQRRQFILSRFLFAWKYYAKRNRSRRNEAEEDQELLLQLELDRVQNMPKTIRVNTPGRMQQSRAKSEERAPVVPHHQHTSSSPLSTADLDDSFAYPFSYRLPASSNVPSLPASLSASSVGSPSRPSLALNNSQRLAQYGVPPRSADQEWRLTPIKPNDQPILNGLHSLNKRFNESQLHPRPASRSPTRSPRATVSQSNPSELAQLAASFSAPSTTIPAASSSATSSPRAATSTSPTISPSKSSRSLSTTPRRAKTNGHSTVLSPPRSRARRRQEELDHEAERKQELELLDERGGIISPASKSFVSKLFAD